MLELRFYIYVMYILITFIAVFILQELCKLLGMEFLTRSYQLSIK